MWVHHKATGQAPRKCRRHTAVYYQNHMYIFGGNSTDFICEDRYLNSLYGYNITLQKWTPIYGRGNIPYPRCGHTAVMNNSGSMYVWGGNTLGTVTALCDTVLYEYQFARKRWRSIRARRGKVPCARQQHTMVYNENDNSIVIFGGLNMKSYLSDLHQFLLSTRTWRELKEAPIKVGAHSAVLKDGVMYVFGGKSDFEERFNCLFMYDFSTNLWTEIEAEGEIPSKRGGMTLSVVNDSLIMYGGYDGKTDCNDIYEFHIPTKKWKCIDAVGEKPRPRCLNTAVVGPDMTIIFYGGLEKSNREDVVLYGDVHELILPERIGSPWIMKRMLRCLINEKLIDVEFDFSFV